MGEHTEGFPVQLYPLSSVQVEEQPSPSATFPSSHSSTPLRRESPHMGEQTAPGVGHENPDSRSQVLEQPSPLIVFPSSQVLGLSTIPEPQLEMQSIWEEPLAWVTFIRSYPVLQLVHSIWEEPLVVQLRQWLRAEQSTTQFDPSWI